MAVQVGIGTFLGSDGGVTGYCDDSGRGLMRMKSSLDRAKFRRMPSMAGSREAARLFGGATKIAAGIWRNVPKGMKRIMDAGAFNRLVGTCRRLQDETGNICDFEGLEGVDLNVGSLSGGMGSRWLSGEGGGTKSEEYAALRVPHPADFDERLKSKDESRAAVVGCGTVRFVMAQRFVGAGVVHCAPTDANLGSMAEFRAGLAAIRAERAFKGAPVRRRRFWVAACEVGTVTCYGGNNARRLSLVEKGSLRLGKGGFVTDWEVSDDFRVPGLWEIPGLNPAGVADEATDLERRLGFAVREGDGTGVYVVLAGVEVAEKRGRHWVRMPYACGVEVVGCLEQNLQNSQNSQNCDARGAGAEGCDVMGNSLNLEDLGEGVGDLCVDEALVELKVKCGGLVGAILRVLKGSLWDQGDMDMAVFERVAGEFGTDVEYCWDDPPDG